MALYNLFDMQRLLIVLIALFLPLQLAWSAASAYCQHEGQQEAPQESPRESPHGNSAARAQHLGHHFHAHHGDVKKAAGTALAADPDCASCHAAGVIPMLMADVVQALALAPVPEHGTAAPHFRSAHARAPDRPQWLRLV